MLLCVLSELLIGINLFISGGFGQMRQMRFKEEENKRECSDSVFVFSISELVLAAPTKVSKKKIKNHPRLLLQSPFPNLSCICCIKQSLKKKKEQLCVNDSQTFLPIFQPLFVSIL